MARKQETFDDLDNFKYQDEHEEDFYLNENKYDTPNDDLKNLKNAETMLPNTHKEK